MLIPTIQLKVTKEQLDKLKEVSVPYGNTVSAILLKKTVLLVTELFADIPEIQKILLLGVTSAWVRPQIRVSPQLVDSSLELCFTHHGGRNNSMEMTRSLPYMLADLRVEVEIELQ